MTIAQGQPFSLVVGAEMSEGGIFGELLQVAAVGSPAAGFNQCTNATGGGPLLVYDDAVITACALTLSTKPPGSVTPLNSIVDVGKKILVPAFSPGLCSFYGWFTNSGDPYLAYFDYTYGKLYCVLDIAAAHFVQLAGY